nr:hypothetical protein [Terriglobus albidus]
MSDQLNFRYALGIIGPSMGYFASFRKARFSLLTTLVDHVFNTLFVNNGTHFLNLALTISVKNILIENHVTAIDLDAQKPGRWMTIEVKNGGDKGRLDDQKVYVEVKIRNLLIIGSKHRLIAGQTELLPVVYDVISYV